MLGCECFCWHDNHTDDDEFFPLPLPQPFSLPSPIPDWPSGQGFATGKINLGELEVVKITEFESVWSCDLLRGKAKGVTFYKPVGIPDGFFCLGYYCQPNGQPLRGYVLAARERVVSVPEDCRDHDSDLGFPALRKPVNYSLIWSSDSLRNGCGFFWLPNAPVGYKAMGILVTDMPEEPNVDEVRCVREDLTESCEIKDAILFAGADPFQVWNTRPCKRGMFCKGVSVGTFFCSTYFVSEDEELEIACLKNLDPTLHAMPDLNQIHALIKHYGARVFFHPDEDCLPSSVQWFFKNGALLCEDGKLKGEPIDYRGSNLPCGGTNDGAFWIDLPGDDSARNNVKKGNLESAELYVHVKPALGGTFTDVVMWIFCPFNGPANLKIGLMNIQMSKLGQHVSDWEHFTLRISNFTGELWQVYFSQHSGGEWVDAFDLEYIEGNKPIVYSSKHGHASFPHPGMYLQGSVKLGIGIRNDAARSKYFVDSSTRYQIIAAEHLGDGVVTEPCWLNYMREWGPTIVYDSRSELDRIINLLPFFVRFSVENIFDLFPTELYGEEGPTGPKEKDNWEGDERCNTHIHVAEADGWMVEMISLLSNPNHVRPKRFWGVYTKLKIFNMTNYEKVVYLDADTIVVKNIEDIFKCEKFCANLKHSERLNSGVLVVEPSEAVFNDMMSKVNILPSYTGGDQGFLNSYFSNFPNAHLFDPNIPEEVLKSRPAPEMERLSTHYNADVGLYVLANKWMVDESELRVIHYTLGPFKPWDWWTSWLLKPVDVWQNIREQLDESLPGTGGGKNPNDELRVKFLFLLPFCRVEPLLTPVFLHLLPLTQTVKLVSPLYFFPNSAQTKVPACLGAISVFVCFMAAVVSLGISISIVPQQVMPWTGLLLTYEWTFTIFFPLFGAFLHLIYHWGKTAAQSGPVASRTDSFDSDSRKGSQRQTSSCDMVTWYYGLGMAFLAIAAPSLPYIFGITALFPRSGLMVVGGLVLALFLTYASEHLAIRSFLKGLEDRNYTRSRSACFLC
ncbi:hypothetical protein V6N12_015532 [Hibiscus sabdariffa]|uniref:Uncharacterized protein n=1 Tax=Hibiscus sabdariffa TaxID=183260 RepID=A0ABR2DNF3_9ROSI